MLKINHDITREINRTLLYWGQKKGKKEEEEGGHVT